MIFTIHAKGLCNALSVFGNGHEKLIQLRKSRTCIFLRFAATVLVVLNVLAAPRTFAQNLPQGAGSAMTELALHLAEPLKHVKATKVIVFDLRGASGQAHPAGKWLADQLSLAIEARFPRLAAVDRSQANSEDEITAVSTNSITRFSREVDQARAVGADAFITGDFGKVSESQIGVSLTIVGLTELEKTHETRTALIPISKEFADLSKEPIPGLVLEGGIPRSGKGGISMPICTYCPPPEFRQGESSGTVQLEIVVTSQGRPERITLLQAPTDELAASAVRVVQTWRFKPAVGFDGTPISVVTPIQFSFRR